MSFQVFIRSEKELDEIEKDVKRRCRTAAILFQHDVHFTRESFPSSQNSFSEIPKLDHMSDSNSESTQKASSKPDKGKVIKEKKVRGDPTKPKTPRSWFSGSKLKTALANLGLTASPDAIGLLAKLAEKQLSKFSDIIIEKIMADGLTSVDRDAIPGDEKSLPHAIFPITPFQKKFKTIIKDSLKAKNLDRQIRFQEQALAKAARAFQASLQETFKSFNHPNLKKKGALRVITAEILNGKVPDPVQPKKRKQKEKHLATDGKDSEVPKRKKQKVEKEDKKEERKVELKEGEEVKNGKESEKKDSKETTSEKLRKVRERLEERKKEKTSRKDIMKRAMSEKFERLQKDKSPSRTITPTEVKEDDEVKKAKDELAKEREALKALRAQLEKDKSDVMSKKKELFNDRKSVADDSDRLVEPSTKGTPFSISYILN